MRAALAAVLAGDGFHAVCIHRPAEVVRGADLYGDGVFNLGQICEVEPCAVRILCDIAAVRDEGCKREVDFLALVDIVVVCLEREAGAAASLLKAAAHDLHRRILAVAVDTADVGAVLDGDAAARASLVFRTEGCERENIIAPVRDCGVQRQIRADHPDGCGSVIADDGAALNRDGCRPVLGVVDNHECGGVAAQGVPREVERVSRIRRIERAGRAEVHIAEQLYCAAVCRGDGFVQRGVLHAVKLCDIGDAARAGVACREVVRVRDDFDIFRDIAEVCDKGGHIVRLDKGIAVGKEVNRISVITEVARRGDLDCGQHTVRLISRREAAAAQRDCIRLIGKETAVEHTVALHNQCGEGLRDSRVLAAVVCAAADGHIGEGDGCFIFDEERYRLRMDAAFMDSVDDAAVLDMHSGRCSEIGFDFKECVPGPDKAGGQGLSAEVKRKLAGFNRDSAVSKLDVVQQRDGVCIAVRRLHHVDGVLQLVGGEVGLRAVFDHADVRNMRAAFGALAVRAYGVRVLLDDNIGKLGHRRCVNQLRVVAAARGLRVEEIVRCEVLCKIETLLVCPALGFYLVEFAAREDKRAVRACRGNQDEFLKFAVRDFRLKGVAENKGFMTGAAIDRHVVAAGGDRQIADQRAARDENIAVEHAFCFVVAGAGQVIDCTAAHADGAYDMIEFFDAAVAHYSHIGAVVADGFIVFVIGILADADIVNAVSAEVERDRTASAEGERVSVSAELDIVEQRDPHGAVVGSEGARKAVDVGDIAALYNFRLVRHDIDRDGGTARRVAFRVDMEQIARLLGFVLERHGDRPHVGIGFCGARADGVIQCVFLYAYFKVFRAREGNLEVRGRARRCVNRVLARVGLRLFRRFRRTGIDIGEFLCSHTADGVGLLCRVVDSGGGCVAVCVDSTVELVAEGLGGEEFDRLLRAREGDRRAAGDVQRAADGDLRARDVDRAVFDRQHRIDGIVRLGRCSHREGAFLAAYIDHKQTVKPAIVQLQVVRGGQHAADAVTVHFDGQRNIGIAAAVVNVQKFRIGEQRDDVTAVCFRKRVVERVVERARALVFRDVRRGGGQRKECGTEKQDDDKSAQVFSHSYLPGIQKVVFRQKQKICSV